MIRRTALGLALTLVRLTPAAAYDTLGETHPCPEGHLPAICCFEPTPDGFAATLCGLHSRQWDAVDHLGPGRTMSTESRERDRPRVRLEAGSRFRWLDPVSPGSPRSCPTPRVGAASDYQETQPGRWAREAPGCPTTLGAVLSLVSQEEFARLRPRSAGNGAGKQQVGACVEHGGAVWFGLAFYDSEGETGVGGVGRFDPRTGKVELRRLPLLRDWSSAALLNDGRWLWLATYRYAEGGDEPAIGVVRYDWTHDKLVVEADAMCGFLALGMVERGGALWLASDGGLSRRTPDGRWEHFVFRVGESPAIVRTRCAQVYDLARTTLHAGEHQDFEERIRRYVDARKRARAAAGRR